MSEPIQVQLLSDPKGSDIPIVLRRHDEKAGAYAGKKRKPVLLLHGASGNYRTFMVPGEGGLAAYLAPRFDPWFLDWRGSGLVVDEAKDGYSFLNGGQEYTFNLAAEQDVPRAIRTIQKHCGDGPVAALGFCMGSAILAEAIAMGHIGPKDVDCAVLMTLGLFYETGVDGRLKTEERLLERLEGMNAVDPRVAPSKEHLLSPWPPELEELYGQWPEALKAHPDSFQSALDPVAHMCNRLSFMYGMPYHHQNLDDSIHAEPTESSGLPHLFGAIPRQMYIHGAKNIRVGHATDFNRKRPDADFVSDEARDRFRALEKVTLITGDLNRLWHRNSIDLMHEWLTRGEATHRATFQKHVLRGYGHQDLLWGKSSRQDVFPKIVDGLSP
jgi:cholesterol oxidase